MIHRPRASLVLAGLAAVALLLGACAIEPTYRGHIEIWNRTETPIKIIGRERNLVVPPCGHLAADDFVLNRYYVADAEGRFVAWHGGGSNPASVLPAFELVTAEGAVYSSSEPPPEPLPPCRGTLEGQPGSNVESDRP